MPPKADEKLDALLRRAALSKSRHAAQPFAGADALPCREAEAQVVEVNLPECTSLYLAELAVEKLGERVNFANDKRSVAAVLSALIIHLAGHAGEIVAVKGMQGLPF